MSAAKELRQFAREGVQTEPGQRDIIAAELADEQRAENGATLNKVFQPSEWATR